MIVICCVDERNGMSFEGRRNAQDRRMRDDVRTLFPCLSMDAYAYGLYGKDDVKCDYEICEDLRDSHYPCILETTPPSAYEDKIEKIVLYQWHNRYPATVTMDIDLHDEKWECVDHYCFEGSSHEKITRAIFQKKVVDVE
jgi:hypothetical protein